MRRLATLTLAVPLSMLILTHPRGASDALTTTTTAWTLTTASYSNS